MSYTLDEMVTNSFLEHWGLTALPFSKVADSANAFSSRQFDMALPRLAQLVRTKEIGVVTGEAGTGKSTLMDIFLSKLPINRFKTIVVDNPQNARREMYRCILASLGVNTTWHGANALRVEDLLTYSYIESGRPNVLVIDEAHILGQPVLEELRLLSNARVKKEPLLTLVMFGQPALASALKSPDMIPFAQRIGAWITLGPMSEEETSAYIDWQIKAAGGEHEIFLSGTKKAVHRRSQGNTRLVNRLCWECLNQGCIDDVKTISEELFAYVCKNLGPYLAS